MKHIILKIMLVLSIFFTIAGIYCGDQQNNDQDDQPNTAWYKKIFFTWTTQEKINCFSAAVKLGLQGWQMYLDNELKKQQVITQDQREREKTHQETLITLTNTPGISQNKKREWIEMLDDNIHENNLSIKLEKQKKDLEQKIFENPKLEKFLSSYTTNLYDEKPFSEFKREYQNEKMALIAYRDHQIKKLQKLKTAADDPYNHLALNLDNLHNVKTENLVPARIFFNNIKDQTEKQTERIITRLNNGKVDATPVRKIRDELSQTIDIISAQFDLELEKRNIKAQLEAAAQTGISHWMNQNLNPFSNSPKVQKNIDALKTAWTLASMTVFACGGVYWLITSIKSGGNA